MTIKLPWNYSDRFEIPSKAEILEAKSRDALETCRKEYQQIPQTFMGMPVKTAKDWPDGLVVFTDAESKPLGAVRFTDEKETKK